METDVDTSAGDGLTIVAMIKLLVAKWRLFKLLLTILAIHCVGPSATGSDAIERLSTASSELKTAMTGVLVYSAEQSSFGRTSYEAGARDGSLWIAARFRSQPEVSPENLRTLLYNEAVSFVLTNAKYQYSCRRSGDAWVMESFRLRETLDDAPPGFMGPLYADEFGIPTDQLRRVHQKKLNVSEPAENRIQLRFPGRDPRRRTEAIVSLDSGLVIQRDVFYDEALSSSSSYQYPTPLNGKPTQFEYVLRQPIPELTEISRGTISVFPLTDRELIRGVFDIESFGLPEPAEVQPVRSKPLWPWLLGIGFFGLGLAFWKVIRN